MKHGAYDSWKTTAPDEDGPIPGDCPVCDGVVGEPCSEECAQLIADSGGARGALASRAEASMGKTWLGVASPDVHERSDA